MLKWLFGSKDPIVYRVPLQWFDQQLPTDLLETGLYWVWESARGGKTGTKGVPEVRPPTRLTSEMAAAMRAELGEYTGDIGRAFLAFATEGPVAISAEDLKEAIRAFAKNGAGPLLAIVHQAPEGASEFVIPRAAHPALIQVLGTWATRLGKPVGAVETSPGGKLLRHLFLDAKTARPVSAFPPIL